MRVQKSWLAILIAVVATAVVPGNRPAAAQSPDFRWHGSVAQGNAIEVKGVNGDVRAEASGSNEVEVVAEKHAQRSNPEDVRIEVVTHADGVTICAVYPSRDTARPNVCAPGKEGRMNVQNNDVTVRFTVRVPAGVRLIGTTVNGDVEATRLNGPILLSTVNGSVELLHVRVRPRDDCQRNDSRGIGSSRLDRHAGVQHRQRQHQSQAARGSEHRRQSTDRERRHLDGVSADRDGTHFAGDGSRARSAAADARFARNGERRHQPQAIVGPGLQMTDDR